jgi:DNA-binding beta-propeller fold protein YncE
VAAVLGDAEHRVAVLGGRDGMPRSLGSVYGGSVTRFLGGSCRGVESRVINAPGLGVWSNGVALSRDGCTLLVTAGAPRSHAIHVFRVADGSLLRVVGGVGDGPLQFSRPRQVWVACDGHILVADRGNHRVQVLTPTLDFHGFVGVGQLHFPSGVCANDDVVVVSEFGADRVSVFNRGDGALRHRFGSGGGGDGQLNCPLGLCFMSCDRRIAVMDSDGNRVSIFSVDGGDFVRHIGVGVLSQPQGVACSAFDELVVADWGSRRVVVFGAGGDVVMTMGRGDFTGIAIHGDTIFASDRKQEKCVLFQ